MERGRAAIEPHTLSVGKIKMLPSSFYLRLSFQPNKEYDAVTSFVNNGNEFVYKIDYVELKRTLEITFQSSFPFKIVRWKEMYGNQEITTAELTSPSCLIIGTIFLRKMKF